MPWRPVQYVWPTLINSWTYMGIQCHFFSRYCECMNMGKIDQTFDVRHKSTPGFGLEVVDKQQTRYTITYILIDWRSIVTGKFEEGIYNMNEWGGKKIKTSHLLIINTALKWNWVGRTVDCNECNIDILRLWGGGGGENKGWWSERDRFCLFYALSLYAHLPPQTITKKKKKKKKKHTDQGQKKPKNKTNQKDPHSKKKKKENIREDGKIA